MAKRKQNESRPRRFFDRDSVEFARVMALTDGVFAIAATLLVVSIEIPDLPDPESVDALADALGDLLPSITGFIIGFAVIGRYWYAHHGFVATLRGIDSRLIGLTLVYLGVIAFMPFPTAILGDYFENPLSIAVYAAIVGAASGLEVVLFVHAYRARLPLAEIGNDAFRWGVFMSFLPVVFFAASVPLAFVSTTVAVLAWVALGPVGALLSRWAPEGAEELFGN